jgi:hypothetical protein
MKTAWTSKLARLLRRPYSYNTGANFIDGDPQSNYGVRIAFGDLQCCAMLQNVTFFEPRATSGRAGGVWANDRRRGIARVCAGLFFMAIT